MKANGKVIKYGDNIDTDVIIPARYLNTTDHKELASHCMEDIDKEFVKTGHLIAVHPNDNTATVYLKAEDLIDIIKEHGNQVEVITL